MTYTDPEPGKWQRANKVGMWLIVAPLGFGVGLVVIGVLLHVVFGVN